MRACYDNIGSKYTKFSTYTTRLVTDRLPMTLHSQTSAHNDVTQLARGITDTSLSVTSPESTTHRRCSYRAQFGGLQVVERRHVGVGAEHAAHHVTTTTYSRCVLRDQLLCFVSSRPTAQHDLLFLGVSTSCFYPLRSKTWYDDDVVRSLQCILKHG